jgi:hypothetical protein
MSSKSRKATWFVPILVLAIGLVFAQSGWSATVTVVAFTTAAPFTAVLLPGDGAKLVVGQILETPFADTPTITAIAGDLITLSSQILPSTTFLPQPVVFASPGAVPEFYQINYLASPQGGGTPVGVIDITNDGQLGADAFGPLSGTTGRICVNVYVFTADEQESECCSCLVTPNALVHLSASDLTGNPGNGVTPTLGVVVKLLATIPGTTTAVAGVNTQATFTGSACNPALPFNSVNLAPGMRAWEVSNHIFGSPTVSGVSKTAFLTSPLSLGELTKLTNLCQFLSGNQSGAGLCKACSLGGLGAGRR